MDSGNADEHHDTIRPERDVLEDTSPGGTSPPGPLVESLPPQSQESLTKLFAVVIGKVEAGRAETEGLGRDIMSALKRIADKLDEQAARIGRLEDRFERLLAQLDMNRNEEQRHGTEIANLRRDLSELSKKTNGQPQTACKVG
jgi:hypothetical protein